MLFTHSLVIISKNVKMTCDLAWELIYYSSIKPINYCGLTDRFGLLFWLKQTISTYHNVTIEGNYLLTILPLPPTLPYPHTLGALSSHFCHLFY